MSSPKISICIPAYNHQATIGYTIESILNQTYQNFELIISDDNSTDKTIEVAKSFKDSRIKIIENKINSGVSVNCNMAIKNAIGDYISIIASDDIMLPTRLEKSINFLEKNSEFMAVFGFVETIDENNTIINHKIKNVFNQNVGSDNILKKLFYSGNFLCAPSTTMRRDLFNKTSYFNSCLLQLQDFDFWIRILVNNYKIKILPEPLIQYRVSGNNLSAIDKPLTKQMATKINFEYSYILNNFLSINNFELTSSFLDLSDYPVIDAKYFHFYLASESLKIANKMPFYIADSYKKFALNLLCNMLNNENLKQEINKNFNFSITDFYQTYQHNILFNLIDNSHYKKKNMFQKLKRSFYKRIGKTQC